MKHGAKTEAVSRNCEIAGRKLRVSALGLEEISGIVGAVQKEIRKPLCSVVVGRLLLQQLVECNHAIFIASSACSVARVCCFCETPILLAHSEWKCKHQWYTCLFVFYLSSLSKYIPVTI